MQRNPIKSRSLEENIFVYFALMIVLLEMILSKSFGLHEAISLN